MDLILDANGAFAWSRGPTTAPILSIAAARLTVDEPRLHGHSAPDPASEPGEPSAGEHPADPYPSGGPAAPNWQIDPAAWAATQFVGNDKVSTQPNQLTQ